MFYSANLEIDLSQRKIEKKETDRKLIRDFLGGKGINAKILWDRVPPEVDAFSPDNLLIVSTGLLTGTVVPGANRTTVTFKSPMTELHCYSNLGGFFGAEMKSAGYDRIIFSGRSPAPVYLWINNDRVELRDASHLWGKDTFETQRLLKKELNYDDVKILCIGPAGENRVYSASIEHASGSSASRGGAGAIMGDKRLKAVVARGSKDVNLANPVELAKLSQGILDRAGQLWASMERRGPRLIEGYARNGDYGNRGGYVSPELRYQIEHAEQITQDYLARTGDPRVACYNCAYRCHHTYPRPNGDGSLFIKCTSWGAALLCTKLFDMDLALAFYDSIEKHGLDSLAVANQIAFAIDLYQRGILTKEDTDGINLEWKNAEIALSLVEKIARREGIGDLLANGVYRAAQKIGRGAEQYAYHVKKYDQHPFKREGFAALLEAVNDKGNTISLIGPTPETFLERKNKDAFWNLEFFNYPEEFQQYVHTKPDSSGEDYEGTLRFIAYNELTYNLADSLGLCQFWTGRYAPPAINSRSLIVDLISAATGMQIDESELTRIARRVINLGRVYNLRAGLTRADDSLPERYFQIPASPGKWKPDHTLFNKWVDRWYEIKGWDKYGIPTAGTLEEVGLDYVVPELEQRGISVLRSVPVTVS